MASVVAAANEALYCDIFCRTRIGIGMVPCCAGLPRRGCIVAMPQRNWPCAV